jgi:hypothetical protein
MVVHPQCKGRTTTVGIKDSLLLPMARCNNLQCSIKGLMDLLLDMELLKATECQI